MIECEGLVKIYRASGVEVFALQGLDLRVAEGEVVAVLGNSGSGKSTLMNVLGGLDAPSAGTARVGEWDLTKLTARRRDAYRRSVTGFVWQNSGLNLLPYLTAQDNLLLAMAVAGRPALPAEARQLLDLVGMEHRANALPTAMSGGEQQRVAVAVALAGRPRLLLADEPTGALDAASAELVMDALHRINAALGTTILLVTHDIAVARHAMRTVRIRDGKVSGEAMGEGDEVVVLDSAGRLQIPRGLLEAAGIGLRAEVSLRGSEVVVHPPRRTQHETKQR
ncbi:MAG TPA: ABC transporter ATP-binding protein [Symbiobacteriaceae bacterium]|nr:ABC transporter ATP-binding protein [Symbiobacteriaceae bacterium]